jgi:hypothetical protein
MGLYAHLLIRYLRVPADTLSQSLDAAGIEADMQAKPVFIDDEPRCDEHAQGHRHPRVTVLRPTVAERIELVLTG